MRVAVSSTVLFVAFITSCLVPELTEARPTKTLRPGSIIPISKRSTLDPTKPRKVANLAALRNEWAHLHTKYDRTLALYEQNVGHPHVNAVGRNRTRHWRHPQSLGTFSNSSYGNSSNTDVTGDEPLIDSHDELWYGTVEIGTPPRTFTIDFDSGSSDLFVPEAKCGSCGNHTRYDPASSSTSRALGKSFELFYGDGSNTSGEQYADVVTVSGLTASSQTLGAASTYSKSFESGAMDGLMGLAWPQISSFKAAPFFQTLMTQGTIPSGQGQFAFYLSDKGSELHLGGVDDTKYKGEVTWTDVTTPGYWQVDMAALSVGGHGSAAKEAVGTTSVIIDSGTTLILGSSEGVAQVYSQIPGAKDARDVIGQGFYTFPCGSVPDVSVTFGGKTFSVAADYFNLGAATEEDDSDCVGAIVASGSNPFWIMGDAMMRNVYTVFDFDQKRVGFADLAI